jgi:hypothetical protein
MEYDPFSIDIDHDHDADDHFGMSSDTLAEYDDMLYVEIGEYVEKAMRGASDEEHAALESAYMGPELSLYRHATGPDPQAGGARTEASDCLDRTLELQDTLHDAKCKRNPVAIEYVTRIVMGPKYELPAPKLEDGTLLARITPGQCADHEAFLEAMTKTAKLDIMGEDIENPLHDKDYRTEVAPRPVLAVRDIPTFEKTYAETARTHDARVKHAGFDGLEIWTTRAMTHSRAKVFRVARFCNTVRRMFSSKAQFVLDVPDALVRLLLKYRDADKYLGEKYVVANDTVNSKIKNDWTFVKCDASFLDPGDHPGSVIDRRETGVVSLPGSRVKAEFFGTDGVGAEYVATSEHYPAGEHFGKRKYVVDHTWVPDGEEGAEMYTQGGVALAARTRPSDAEGEIARYFALKRFGDWGQVQHCARYGMVFVTTDKPAFLYAMVKNARAMLMIVDAKGAPGCLAYSFVMFNPSVVPQRGGASRTTNIVAAVALVTLMFGVVIGRA